MFETIKNFVTKYALYGALLISAGAMVCSFVLYNMNASKARTIADLTTQNEQLQGEVKWRDEAEAAVTQNAKEKDTYQREADESRDKLEKLYEKHRDWADAPLPDDITDGLRDHLRKR